MSRPLVMVLCAAGALALTGCPGGGLVCDAPKTKCTETTCANLDLDPVNCGGCGIVCASGQQCAAGKCECRSGTTLCGGACSDLASDPLNCGACGTACDPAQFCKDGACVTSCTDPANPTALTACGKSCVNLKTSLAHCGTCGTVCGQGTTCLEGECRSTVFAACFNTGELVALDDDLTPTGASKPTGAGPQSLGVHGGQLLLGDTLDNLLYAYDLKTLAKAGYADVLGKAMNQIVVSGDHVFAVNTSDNNVQVVDLSKPAPSGVAQDNSRTLENVPTKSSTSAGTENNTLPSHAALLGSKLYVTLPGKIGEPGAAGGCSNTTPFLEGNSVLELDVSKSPGAVVGKEWVFKASDYATDSGAANMPRPSGIAAANGKLYATIQNLKDVCYGYVGPGYVAIIDPTKAPPAGVTNLKLPDDCRAPVEATASPDGKRVFVSCGGDYGFGASPHEAFVVLDTATDTVKGTTQLGHRCTASDTGTGQSTCTTPVPGRLAFRNGRVYVADANGGRLFVLDMDGKPVAGKENGVKICPLKCFGEGTPSEWCGNFVADVAALP